MNSINDRLARLAKKNKNLNYDTGKIRRLEDIRRTELYRQGNCCASCGISFDGNKDKKPVIDYDDKEFKNVRGVVCEMCEVIIRCCGNNADKLNRIANYMRKSEKDKFESVQQTINDASKTEPSKMGYFDTNWSNVKPNE